MPIFKKNRAFFSRYLPHFLVLVFLILTSCAGQPASPATASSCEKKLAVANKELETAKAKGFGSSIALLKASSLITAAVIQKEFGKYPNCIDKVKRARYYIKQARNGKSG